MTTRQAVIAEAMTWLGTPYHLMGDVKRVGVDCGQLLNMVYSTVGLTPRYEAGHYPSDWHFHRSEERYLQAVEKFAVPTDNPRAGDIAVFQFGRCVSHGAIVVDWPLLIHSHLGQGCVYVDVNDSQLKGRLVGTYTLFKD
jgi:cell wall-associated NlpC family hydrolase